jgi:hypothetical protein
MDIVGLDPFTPEKTTLEEEHGTIEPEENSHLGW